MNCPKCNAECWRDEVDIGVGTIYGPYGCPECGWSEDAEYDRSSGDGNKAEAKLPGWHIDQWGRAIRVEAIVERCERFGIPRQIVEEAFAKDQ